MCRILMIVFLILVTFSLNAQKATTFDDAKFQIVQKAVAFYSKDTATFKNGTVCSETKTFSELEKCASKMDNVKSKVQKWEKIKVQNPADLRNLVDTIEADFTANPKKAYRDTLKEYKIFQSACDAIIRGCESGHTEIKASDTTSIEDQMGKSSNTSSLGNLSDGTTGKVQSYIVWIVIGVLFIISIIFTWVRTSNISEDIRISNLYNVSNRNTRSGDSELADKVKKLDNEVKLFETRIDELRDQFNKKISRLNEGNQQELTTVAKRVPVNDVSDPTKIAATTKYAKWADEGDSFSIGMLTDESDNEKIFEISIQSPTTAKFRVTTNRNAQLFSLTNFDRYLGKTCKFDTVPNSNSTIINERDGDLRLQGNKWQITTPVEIRFV